MKATRKKSGSKVPPRRFPKVLSDELREALAALRDLPRQKLDEYLARWRVNDVAAIPAECVRAIARLDFAFRLWHHWRDGGAKDYIAHDVTREIQRERGKLSKRGPKVDHAALYAHLLAVGYEGLPHGHKKRARLDAADLFRCKERTISDAIRRAGLQRHRAASAK